MSHGEESKSSTTDFDEIAIGQATSEDVQDLLALVSACINHMRYQDIDQWDEIYPDRKTVEANVQSGTAFVAYHRGKIVGMLVLNEHQDPEYTEVPWQFMAGPVAVVHRLMICPTLEGRGIARLLMKYAEESAERSGYRIMRLDAFMKNPRALRLYEKLGYRNAGQVQFRKGCFLCFEKVLVRTG